MYFHDGDGKRVKKYVPSTGETTIFIYDASGKMVAEYSTIVAPTQTAQVSYLTNDHLGSPRVTTDKDGKVFSRRDFMPFGEEITSEHTLQRDVNLNYGEDGVRQKFTGYERDGETELDFAQARYYNMIYGRFTSPDIPFISQKIENPQSWNLFLYVHNNPSNQTDPTGLKPFPFDDNPLNCLCSKPRRLGDDLPQDLRDEIFNKTFQIQGQTFVLPREMKLQLQQDAEYFYNRGIEEGRLYTYAKLEIFKNSDKIKDWNNSNQIQNDTTPTFSYSGEIGEYICINYGQGCADTTIPKTYSRNRLVWCGGIFPFCTQYETMSISFDAVNDYNKYINDTNTEWNKRFKAFNNRWRNTTTTINGRRQTFGNWAVIIWADLMTRARRRGQRGG